VKSARDTAQLFQQSGFTLVRSKNHMIWRCPCGRHQLVTSTSRCGGRGDENAKADIRRTLRACSITQEEKAS
jgi:hypothetical protein